MGRRRKVGRPSKLTAAVREQILLVLRGGNYREAAAHYAGISPETLSRWFNNPRYTTFRQAVLKAEQDAEIHAVTTIFKAGATDPKHLEWWLERKFPDRWGRKDRVDIGAASSLRIVLEEGGTEKLS